LLIASLSQSLTGAYNKHLLSSSWLLNM